MDIKLARIREGLKDLTLFDDELMTLAFQDDCAFTEFLLNAICPQAGFKVKEVKSQLSLYNVMGRALKLDILADDALGRKVNIEVQQLPKGAIAERARFHASLLDVHLLDKGKDFNELPTTFIIFITKTDVLGGGLPVYTVERHINELQKPFDDKNVILYVNGECMDDTLLGRIMHDFQCASPDEMKCQIFADKLKNLKKCEEDRPMGALFDSFYEEGLEQGLEQGREEGLEQGREEGLEQGREEGLEQGREEGRQTCANMIYRYMRKHQCTLNEALELFEVPEEDVTKVVALVNAKFAKLREAEQQMLLDKNLQKLELLVQPVVKYIQKTGCMVVEALDFFEIPESDHAQMLSLLNLQQS